MSSLVYRISSLLCRLVNKVPVGTNLALFHLLGMFVSGRLLSTRGALIPALAECGLAPDAVRRAWAALAYGDWQVATLLQAWQQIVRGEARFRAHCHGGFGPVAADLVGFFRPRLQGCPSKHYNGQAGKALPAICLGLLAGIGSVEGQRLPLPRAFVRSEPQDTDEKDLQARLLQQAGVLLTQEEALVTDRGFALSQVQQAGVKHYVCRVAKNFTARRAAPPQYKGRGRRPSRGAFVRPLSRRYKGRLILATPPDREERWQEAELWVRAHVWEDLVLTDAGAQSAQRLRCVVIWHPRYREPLLLCTNLSLCAADLLARYRDRWPVEQLPLAAKQMLGASRQFVFAAESCQRLPELALLAGSIVSYVAATQAALATGFWDRCARPTPGRLRRVLARVSFSEFVPADVRVRKKPSATAHLPKGILGHRRQKRATSAANVQSVTGK